MIKKINWRLLIFAYSSLFILGMTDNGRGPSYPLWLDEFSLEPGHASLIFSLASFAGLITTLLHKKWYPKLGEVRGTQFFISLIALSSLVTFLTKIIGLPFNTIIFSSILLGIGMGGTGITINIMVAESCPAEKLKNSYAGLHACYGISSLIAPLIFTYIKDYNLNWSHYFLFSSILGLIVSLTTPSSKYHSKLDESDNKLTIAPFKTRLFVGIMVGSYVSSEILVSSRLVYFLRDSLKFSDTQANFELTKFFICLAIGRIFFGIIKVPGKTVTWLMLSLITSLTVFIIALLGAPKLFPLIGLTMSLFFPYSLEWINLRFTKFSKSIISSVMSYFGVFIIFLHVVSGQISQNLGIEYTMMIGPVLLTFSFLVLLKLKKW